VASIHRQQIAQVERLIGKGRNHEAFAVTLADGTCLILRVSITIPSRHLPHFKTASEVATMNYVRQHTSIPVPRVLAWYSHLENPVGNEYILMTAIEGSSLLETLSSMSLADKTAVLDQIIDYQHQLDDLNFDMYGSLYQNADLTYYIGRTTSVEICYVCYPDLAILQFRKGPC
jgi:aminoglycoside phosphotransferase (APT) family kinase protein